MQTGALVVGGGLTGCLSAYLLAAAGVDVVLLEADRIGRGATAFSSGWIAEDPGVPFLDVERAIGRRAARRAFQAWRRAALDFTSLLKRLDIKCHLDGHPSVTVAATSEQLARLKKDQKARKDAGLDATLLNTRAIGNELALDAMAGLRSKAGGTIDPYRACVGLAAAAIDRGARFYENSPVQRIRFTRKTIDVFTAAGPIRAERVVIATGMPGELFSALARHFWFQTNYMVLTDPVPAKIRQQIRSAKASRSNEASRSNKASRSNEAWRSTTFRDSAAPPHIVRWVGDDRVLIGGADAETPPPRLRDKVLVQRTGQLMYELSTLYPDISGIQPAYGWAADYARTVDGLPYIGAHRNYPFHLFAFGDSSHSITGSYLASRIVLRQYSDEMDPADEVFGFHR
jgi:glycine/D-amino acid oxidase-like deaminating enzyme